MPENLTAAERRITLRLLAYWEKRRGDRLMPAEQDIQPDDIRDLWENCFLLRVSAPHSYAHLGQAIADAYRHGLAEADSDGLLTPDAASLSPGYATVLATGKPLLEDGEFMNPQNHLVKYRQCLLPLGENGEIRAVFGGMRFKIVPV